MLSILLSAAVAGAQDFEVATTVYDTTRPESKELSRSLTLFHAGKAYDFIHDVGELIIFEPSQDRFTLVSTRQMRATEIHIDKLQRMLQMARQTLEDHLDALKTSSKPGARVLLEELVFQIDPKFEESFDHKAGDARLHLKSPHFQYDVQCAAPPVPQQAEAYLHYADWICRLNYVLHPGPVFPEQRIALNAALRKSKMIPVEVNFTGEVGQPICLRAQHRIYWELTDKDRELLHQWDSLLARKDLKRVSLQEYQRAVLVSQASHRH